jgi:hypothetical protein
MIGNIGVTGTVRTSAALGGERGGGEIHGPEHHSGGGKVDAATVDDTEDFSTVQSEVAQGHGDAKPRDAAKAAGAGHVAEASAGVKVMAAAGASADGGTLALAAVRESVTAETDDYG